MKERSAGRPIVHHHGLPYPAVARAALQQLDKVGPVDGLRQEIGRTEGVALLAIVGHGDHHHRDVARLRSRLQLAEDGPSVHAGHLHVDVDQAEQVRTGGVDLLQVGDGVLVALVLRVLHQHLAVADDRVHRRAELVAHVGEEGALGPVGLLGVQARFFECGLDGLLGRHVEEVGLDLVGAPLLVDPDMRRLEALATG